MSERALPKVMTTKEVAEALKIGESTLKRAVTELRPLLGEVVTNSQGGYLFEARQVTLLKNEIKKHHNLASRQIDNVSTEIEKIAKIQEAFILLQEMNDEYKRRAEVAEKTVRQITCGNGCWTMNQTAKALKLPFGNITLYEKLRAMGILNADNTPKQEQVNNGNFKVVVKFINDKIGNKCVTLTTGKGLVYLAKKFDTNIDNEIQADA